MMETKKDDRKLHSGKWTPEEEAYVEGLMEEFRAGTLDLQEGTTLRSFLAQKLNCKPKRISKKYEGKNYDGKQLYWNSEEDISPQELRARRAKLQQLEFKFKECLKAIEIAKASRQNPAVPARTKQEGDASFPVPDSTVIRPQPLSAAAQVLGSTGDFLIKPAGTSSPSVPALPHSALPPFFQRPSPVNHQADAALLLARHHRQQALELELQAASASAAAASNQGSFLTSRPHGFAPSTARIGAAAGNFGSFLSGPTSHRQDSFMGFSGLNRPNSPTLAGRNFVARPHSPRTSHQHSLFAEAAALEQARFAVAARGNMNFGNIRPSLNTMLNNPTGFHAVRRSSGNQLAGGAFDESNLMRLQQQPMIRDLGATATNNNLLFSQLCAAQQGEDEQRKRQAMLEEELSQQKRQRFM